MNQVVLTGNLVRDIELKKANDKSVVSNCIAVGRDRKNANGEYESDFFNFTVWEKGADYLAEHGHKGDRIELSGRIQNRTYLNSTNEKVTVTEIMVEKITVFSKEPSKASNAKPQASTDPVPELADIEITDDDLPF